MSWRLLRRSNAREHTTIYVLATASNLFLAIPEYMAVNTAALSYLPVQGSTAWFIARYGIGLGVTLDFLWTLLIFQALLAAFVLTVSTTTLVKNGWRWLYVFSGVIASGFVAYWLGARFLQTLAWISPLRIAGIDSSAVYSDLFWFGLGTTICYVAMILVLRRSYDKLVGARKIMGNLTLDH